MFEGQTESSFNFQYQCKDACSIINTLTFTPSDNTAVTYTSIKLTIMATNNASVPNWSTMVPKQYTITPASPTITDQFTLVKGATILVYGTITFGEDHLMKDPVAYSDVVSRFQFSAATTAYYGDFHIHSVWTNNLLLPNMPGVVNPDVPDPTTYSFSFPHSPPAISTPTTAQRYKFAISFLQYQWSYLQYIDINLHGTYQWSPKNLTLETCLINGQTVSPVFISDQTVRLQLSSFASEALIASTPITLVCGDSTGSKISEGLTILQNSVYRTALKNSATPNEHVISEFVSILPFFAVAEGFTVPILSYSIPLDRGKYNLIPYNRGHVVSMSPEQGYIDNQKKSIYSTFSVEFESIEQYNQPFEMGFSFVGLRIDPLVYDPTSTDPKNLKKKPVVFITIEPDYSVDHTFSSTLLCTSYILPIDVTTMSTSKIRVDQGWNVLYDGKPAPTIFFNGKLPKRYLHIAVPLQALIAEYFPVTTLININSVPTEQQKIDFNLVREFQSKFQLQNSENSPNVEQKFTHFSETLTEFSKTSPQNSLLLLLNPQDTPSELGAVTELFPRILIASSTFENASLSQTILQDKFKSIRRSYITFTIGQNGDYARTTFADTINISYPGLNHRVRHLQGQSIGCNLEYYRCTGSGKNRSCRWALDTDFTVSPTSVSQHGLTLSLVNVAGVIPLLDRRVTCKGLDIISPKRQIFDLRESSGDVVAVTSTTKKVSEKVAGSYKVGTVVSHTATSVGSLLAQSEVYGVKNEFPIWAVFVLAFSPLIIGFIAGVIVIIVVIVKD
jgi:hypothetical protein